MFYTKEVTVFDRGKFKRGHHVIVAVVDNKTKNVLYRFHGLIASVDDYNLMIEEASGSRSSVYAAHVEDYPGQDYNLTVVYRFEEVTATSFSEE